MTQQPLASPGSEPDPAPGGSVLSAPTPQQLRDRLAELVVRDLLGPSGEEPEELAGNPLDHYIIGRLAPGGLPGEDGAPLRTVGKVVEPETLEEPGMAPEQEPEAGDPEPSAPAMPSLHPSTLGLTLRVERQVQELTVDCAWARYERGDSEIEANPKRVWHRVPCSGTVTVKLVEGKLAPQAVQARDFPHIVVRGRARLHEGSWLVSLFLVNGQEDKPGSTHWMFQASMTVSGAPGTAPFLPRRSAERPGSDQDERRSLAMTYRFHPEFAVGHGTGVHAKTDPAEPRRAVCLSTTATPSYEIPHTDVPDPRRDRRDEDLPELADLVLDMSELSKLEAAPLRAALVPLVDGYRSWIERQKQSVDDPATGLDAYRAEAQENMRLAGEAADRIQAGIDLLRDDPEALDAFRFANRAMWHQRVQTIAAGSRRRTPDLPLEAAVQAVDLPDNRSWRPFQLAFLLLNLPSLADPAHPERADDSSALADLLWFPTGGGKTEAYLGLTAFTLAIRRRKPHLGGLDAEHGVAVIMRYTLRLLTIQQFQRAAALICACEVIRREEPARWGRNPFRIGLWVGGRVTPNTTEQAADWVKERKKDKGYSGFGRMGSPHQLTSCPWCGAKMEAGRDIAVETTLRRTLITCSDAYECPFGASVFGLPADELGLPILVVDEEIYRYPPSLVIATVDKFAQLPWKGETQALFGQVSRRCTRHGYVTPSAVDAEWESSSHPASGGHPAASTVDAVRVRPPDLIVQDELHLISGPLGSLTGLYETAVDRLSTWNPEPDRTVRPKVIASTATVRRADRQIHDLFARRTAVFPPSGLDADDTFFARRRPPEETPGRRYVGICAQGVRTKSVAIRVFVAQLAAAQHLYETYGASELTDPYMTLVGYFNSLRDLGGMRRLVEDDVSARLIRADRRGLAARRIGEPAELTSRMASDAIPDILAKLDLTFGRRAKGSPRPIDVLLATNMIAVGVDVSRLGVMVVNNQPKSTAEYIQATSRVGRRAPGLVFTVLNWARPRDLSHYETFESFHATIYQHVEALSVTPFADRAVDRGLTGVLASLVRNLKADYNPNRGAQWVDRRGEVVSHAVRSLELRAQDVLVDRHVIDEVRTRLDARLDYWEQKRRAPGAVLGYRAARRQGDVAPLLLEPDSGPWRLMTCPTSLREVEPPIRLIFTGAAGHEPDEEPPYVPRQQEDSGPPVSDEDPWERT
ncbi:DISARM system helicase DrmA [Streptomyces melanogenes]|uniref:DISARM system helicase DrmA n=1 Tax=Streptomyces melanogenes TaxID=67326 RepID=UPI00167D7C71|nr:DISARM system helicase DrmA [Streptomyces melanogenes]GGP71239.1 helicase [Streptomyces melanogenes]